jgi:peptide/nickel transport system permease protein
MTALARLTLGGWFTVALLASWIAPNPPDRIFAARSLAPPTRVHVFDEGQLSWPFIRRYHLVNALERQYEEIPGTVVPVRAFAGGGFLRVPQGDPEPLLLLGTDALGRDVFSRVVHGARVSLLLALTAAVGTAAAGALLGGMAAAGGGWVAWCVARASELVMALPLTYLLLAMRGALPLVLSPAATFVLTAGMLIAVGWPVVARGVVAIALAERQHAYVDAARASGGGRAYVLGRHLLPAAYGFIRTQIALLVPAAVLAESTLSFAGLGFPDTAPSWGTLLQDTANIGVLASAPWLLAPLAALVSVVLAVTIALRGEPLAPTAQRHPAGAAGAGARPIDSARPVS